MLVNEEKYNNYLSLLLSSYIIILLFIGRFEEFQQISIWLIGPIFAIIIVANFIKNPIKVPKEVYLYGFFWLWTFPGYLSVVYFEGYFRYFRLVFTILVLFFCIQYIIIKSGNIELLYKTLTLNCALYLIYAIISGDFFNITGEENARLHSLAGNSNGFAYLGITGISGILFIWPQIKSLDKKVFSIILLTGFITMIIFTASRSGFITMIIMFTFWIIFCFYSEFKKRILIYVLLILITGPLLYVGYNYILENTYLGERLSDTVEKEGGVTTESRFKLYEEGFEMFKKSPFYGVGLSQFVYYSSTKSFSHSEYMELLSTTGLGGFLIMFFFYYVIIKKIKIVKKFVKNPLLLYRLNCAYAILFSTFVFGFFRPNFLDILTMIQVGFIAGYTNFLAKKYIKYSEERLSIPSDNSNYAV